MGARSTRPRTAADDPAARTALYDELRKREIPLLVMINPRTRAGLLRSWPGGFRAMAAYLDQGSFQQAMYDLGLPMGSVAAAEIPPGELFDWVAGLGCSLALNVYRPTGEVIYVPLAPEIVSALAPHAPRA
jgi:hypothetical protein